MKIGLFLGAGASVPFQKPTTQEFLRKLYSKEFDKTFHDFLLRSLLDVNYFKDIEYVIQAAHDIVMFSDTIGYQFFVDISKKQNTYRHTMVVHDTGSYAIEQVIEEIKNVENTLKKMVFKYYSWTNDENTTLREIYDVIFNFFKQKSESIKIFSTNYDQAVETYCELVDELRLVDGFKHDQNKQRYVWSNGDFTYYDNLTDKTNVYLYKLHGSLNWKEHKSNRFERTNEESIAEDPKYPNNMLVYPGISPKDGVVREPYKSIFRNFENYMKEADGCIVIGFSFRDQQINEVLKSFIAKGKVVVVLSPNSMKNTCENLLGVKIPDNYDEHRASSPAPGKGNVWCIPHPFSNNTLKIDLEIALAHITNNQIKN